MHTFVNSGVLIDIGLLVTYAEHALMNIFGAFAASIVAKESGEALQRSLDITPSTEAVGPLIAQHSMLASQLVLILGKVFFVGVFL